MLVERQSIIRSIVQLYHGFPMRTWKALVFYVLCQTDVGFFVLQVPVALIRDDKRKTKIKDSESLSSFKSGRLSQTELQMSIMLVAVTITFLVLTLPQYIRHVTFTFVDFSQTSEKIALSGFLYHASQKLYMTNSCVNFILYSATGTLFTYIMLLVNYDTSQCMELFFKTVPI